MHMCIYLPPCYFSCRVSLFFKFFFCSLEILRSHHCSRGPRMFPHTERFPHGYIFSWLVCISSLPTPCLIDTYWVRGRKAEPLWELPGFCGCLHSPPLVGLSPGRGTEISISFSSPRLRCLSGLQGLTWACVPSLYSWQERQSSLVVLGKALLGG